MDEFQRINGIIRNESESVSADSLPVRFGEYPHPDFRAAPEVEIVEDGFPDEFASLTYGEIHRHAVHKIFFLIFIEKVAFGMRAVLPIVVSPPAIAFVVQT